MLALLLVGALVAQAALGAPTDCTEFCDDQSTPGFGQRKTSSYSGYSKSSSWASKQRLGSSGLGRTGSRLENFDDNVVGHVGVGELERPGNWQDEKHYITDDGRGQMSYRAGQSVSNNGFSKFAEHSYRYGTQDSHAPLANSQILSTAEFSRELQSMRSRINSFMGNFNLDAGSIMNANTLQEFKSKASVISNQMNNVCNQVDSGSSMYQQMQQMIQQFQRDVEQRQQEMEAVIFQASSRSSTHGSIRYPSRPSTQYAPIQQYPTRPSAIQQYPTRPSPISEDTIVQQRVQEQVTNVQSLISSFYTVFNRPDTNLQYQQDLATQVDIVNQKLADLTFDAAQSESLRLRVERLKTQFDSYVLQLRNRIQDIEKRQREDEARRLEREMQLKIEKQQHEEKMRKLEEERLRLQQQEAERLRLQHEEEERQRQLQLEEERTRLQQEEEERQRLRHLEQERLRLEQEEVKLQQDREEHARILAVQQQNLQQQQLQLQQQQQQQPQYVTPHVTGTLEVSGSSSYEHSIKGTYVNPVSTGATASSGSYVHGSHGSSYTRPQQVMQPHVDLTAATNRLQQDLNRLQNEISHFNMYSARLTSANSASVVSEAEAQAEALRQSINNLCETSGRYQKLDVKSRAEDLGRRLEELFRAFQTEAANYSSQSGSESSSGFSASGGYSSESAYGSTGKYSSVRAPAVTNVQLEHSKSTEIEIGRRPAASQRYSSGSGHSATSGYGASARYGARTGDQFQSGLIDLGQGAASGQQVDCVEMNAGQPCINESRRYRRDVGGN